ncbi:MAG: hypothetical protein EHM58_04915 [Ignavibacteriae bacterium]|nr:MAG: hypothetical protein EHM58_04915 [Ignavibacteriota bacterium]
MNNLNNCRFCDILSGVYTYREIDQPIISNKSYVAIASIGAFVEGWTLIVPKDHKFSMKNFYNDIEFNDIFIKVSSRLFEKYGRIIAFEHGANCENSITSCGTNHAHIHLVPFKTSLLPDLLKSGLFWDKIKASEIPDKIGHNEYLFYTDLDKDINWINTVGYLHILDKPKSQFFRRLIASKLNCLDKFDYKQFPYIDTALLTRNRFIGVK